MNKLLLGSLILSAFELTPLRELSTKDAKNKRHKSKFIFSLKLCAPFMTMAGKWRGQRIIRHVAYSSRY